jgi:hypothetical protein
VRPSQESAAGGRPRTSDHALKQLGRDARLAINAAEQRRGGVPLGLRHREVALSQVPVQKSEHQPRQNDLSGQSAKERLENFLFDLLQRLNASVYSAAAVNLRLELIRK